MSEIKGAQAGNWVLESFESESGGFRLLGTSKGYTSFSRAFNNGDKVFYAAHTDDGHREAGWAIVQGARLVNRTPTATLTPQNVYSEGTPTPIAFSGRGTIACTFNQLPFEMIWEHIFRNDNPHEVKAPQVDLDPVLLPLGPDEQNVQAALEFLYGYFTEHGGGDWHLTHIDGNYVYIEIKHGPDSEFPPTTADLELAELKINHDEGQLWTRLADNTIVKIGDKDFITEAPLDGELYGRKDGDWHRVSLATVSDNMPSDPAEGDLWVDTENTMELYVFIEASGWISMTGAGGGGGGTLPDNIVTDSIDGPIVNKLLGREIDESGDGLWRPIYTDDVVTRGAQPMFRSLDTGRFTTSTDPSAIRDQQTANWFLYETLMSLGPGGDGVSQEEKIALIEAQIQYRGLMELDADDKPVWPADQTKDRGGWWAYPSSKFSSVWKYENLEWIFPHYGEVSEGADEVTKQAAPKYEVGDIIQMQISDNEAGAGTSWRYFDTAPVFVEYKVEELYYPDRLNGNANTGFPAYRVSKSAPDHRYAGSLPNVVKGLQGDPDDAWIQWYPTVFAFGTAVPEVDLGNYVSKTGGDSMEGPLNITTQPGTGSRDTRRINTLGVYSNSDNSSLQLGTSNTKIYVGNNDTSFNGPIKISEIQDRGNGVKIEAPLKFGQQSELIKIETDSGTTQNINLFGANTNSEFTTLKFNIQGATWKNAIEFESGGSSGKETILRLDSNKGIRARNLNMDDTRITDLDDPTQQKDAVNLRTVEGRIDDLAESLRDRLDTLVTDNSAGEMKFSIVQAPTANGQFTCMTANGAASTYDPLQTREIWSNNTNLSGYDFGWSDVKPNSYFFMSGPGDALARFRVVAAPVDQGTWSKIRVADAEVYPDGQQWVVNDIWGVLFRSFTGESTDLDDYVKKSGDVMTGTLGAPKVEVKDNDAGVLVVEGNQSAPANVAARITMSNAYNSNAYGKIEWHGTTGSNGWFQFSNNVDISSKGLHGVGNIRFKGGTKTIVEDSATRVEFDGRTIINKGNASSGAGFELKGRTTAGTNTKLLQVYHNSSGEDAVNYYGKQQGNENLATVGYVKNIMGGDSGDSGDTPFTPYGPVEIIPSGGIPSAGEISFGNARPSETASIALHKTDKNGEVWDYQFNKDSIFTVTIVDELSGTPLRQTISLRVDGIEDKGNFVVLTTDGRDLSCKQRDESTGDYFFVPDPAAWCFNWGATARPLQKVPVTFDEIFQFRDETSVFPTFMKFSISTGSGDGFSGAARGRIYFEDSVPNPSNIRLCSQDTYGYGFLGRADKTTSAAIVSCPGEMTVFARSKWSKQLIPVEGYYFDSLYFNHSKSSMRLQNWGKSWDDGEHHRLSEDETIFVKFDFSPKAHTSVRMEEQIAELTARLAKLEGGK